MNGVAFQYGTPLMRNSEWPASCGGSVSTISTGVAPAGGGGTIARVTAGRAAFASAGSAVNAIVSTSSTLRYSTLP